MPHGMLPVNTTSTKGGIEVKSKEVAGIFTSYVVTYIISHKLR